MGFSTINTPKMAYISTITNYLKHNFQQATSLHFYKFLMGIFVFLMFLAPNISFGQSIDQLYQWANEDFQLAIREPQSKQFQLPGG